MTTNGYKWVSVTEAAAILGKSERTLRRWASGESKRHDIETRETDGRLEVKIRSNEPERSQDPDEASALRIRVATLEAMLNGKDDLIAELRQRTGEQHQSIERLEVMLHTAQRALPAPAGTGARTIGDLADGNVVPVRRRWPWQRH